MEVMEVMEIPDFRNEASEITKETENTYCLFSEKTTFGVSNTSKPHGFGTLKVALIMALPLAT